MTENPYAPPESRVVAERPDSDLVGGLKSQGTWRLLGLGIITYGAYYAHYCARQTRVINRFLDATTRIPSGLIAAIFVFSYGSLALFFGCFLVDETHPVAIASNVADKLWMLMVVVWGFYARDRVNKLTGLSADPRKILGAWTFFLSPLYFNYKVNVLNEAPAAAHAVAQ